jgi:hypothetical protein
VPVREPHRADLRAIRRGEVPLADVIGAIDEAEATIISLAASSAVPNEPDRRL